MLNEAMHDMIAADKKVRDLASNYLIPKEGSEAAKDAQKMAEGFAATDLVVSLFRIFQGLQNPAENSMYQMLSDLTFGLNTNPFWVRHAGTLMPLFIAAVNAANDARQLRINPEERWKGLEHQSRCLWVELIPAIIFLVHGYGAMQLASLEIKKSFLGLMYG